MLLVRTSAADAVQVYSGSGTILLQLRRTIATETEPAEPSFKVAVELSSSDALRVARDLLAAAAGRLDKAVTGTARCHVAGM